MRIDAEAINRGLLGHQFFQFIFINIAAGKDGCIIKAATVKNYSDFPGMISKIATVQRMPKSTSSLSSAISTERAALEAIKV